MDFNLILFLQNFICSLIETLILSIPAFKLVRRKPDKPARTVALIILFTLIPAIFNYIDSSNILFRILPLASYIPYFCLLFDKKIMQSIYITIISYIYVLIIQLGIVLIFNFTALNQDSFLVQIFANTLTLIIAIILARIIPLYYVYDYVIRKDMAFRFFLGNTFVIIFFVNYLVVAHLSHFIYYIITIVIVVALLVFVNVELLRSRVIVDKQQSIIDSYNQYLPIVDELIEQVRGRQHGYANNIQSLNALAMTCDDYETLRSELLKNIDVMSHSDLPVFLLKFNLKLLSGLLFQKYSVADKQNIHMDFTINNYNIQSVVPEYVIVEAVGILMDNAIEASNENDTIYVTIDCVQNKFYFKIMNIGPTLTSEFYNNIFKRGYTTKPSTGHNQGLGLSQLLDISNKYNGNLCVSNEDYNNSKYLCFSVEL